MRRTASLLLDALDQAIQSYREILAHCLDTLIADCLAVDRLRNLRYPRHATDLKNGLPASVVDHMLDMIDRNSDLARRWWQRKRELLDERTLTIADVRAPLAHSPTLPYHRALSSVIHALREFDEPLADIVESLASDGHIDARWNSFRFAGGLSAGP